MATIHVDVVSAEESIFSGEAKFVALPGENGELGILPRHPPIRYRATVPTAWLQLTLTEGKHRQVRKMTASIGFPTLRLIRTAIAHLQLADLAVGQYRHLTPAELRRLRQITGLSRRADGNDQQIVGEK